MKDTDYWDQFLSTGRIEDYLAYRQNTSGNEYKETQEGAGTHAGTGQGYRDGIGSITGRRDG